MKRRLPIGLAVALVAAAGIYWFLVREGSAEPRVLVPRLAATIGEGSEAVGVSGSGTVIRWLPPPEDPPLPRLPLDDLPEGGKVRGPALQQVRVLAAVPDRLRPYVVGSSFGGGGVEVELTTGIELRFGDATQAGRKWRAAAAVLADPSLTGVDYVDLGAPGRPAYQGSEHELPAAP